MTYGYTVNFGALLADAFNCRAVKASQKARRVPIIDVAKKDIIELGHIGGLTLAGLD
jgi:hypothetical protein